MHNALYTLPVILITACNPSEGKQQAIVRDTLIRNNHAVITQTTTGIPAKDEKDSLAVIGTFDGDKCRRI